MNSCRPVRAGEPGGRPQHATDILRRQLLLGRGPGAPAQEVARHTRDRLTLGGIPTATALELAQLHANMARGDADAIAQDAARVRADLSGTLDELIGRLAPWLAATAVLAGCGLGLLLIARGRRRRGQRVA